MVILQMNTIVSIIILQEGCIKMENRLPNRLKQLRQSKNWSKVNVAEKLGVQLSTYTNWEYGIREPIYLSLAKIAKLYGTSADYLIGLTNNPTPITAYESQEFLKDIQDQELQEWILNLSEEELKKIRTVWDAIKAI